MRKKPYSTTEKGNALEREIYDLLQAEIDADRFWAKRSNCKVFLKKGYFSKDRNSEIVFDVSIEVFLPGEPEYSALVLVECKNYGHPVPVSDAEEFFAKVQQVAAANAKAVIATTASFQAGARQYAKTKGIGLIRYCSPDNFKWLLNRSPSATAATASAESAELVDRALTQRDFRSLAFDLYFQSPERCTNSLWDFFEDLVLDSGLPSERMHLLSNPRSKLINQVPYLETEELERVTMNALSSIGYMGGEVNLELICAQEAKRTGLVVHTTVPPPDLNDPPTVLGRIVFDPLIIQVYASKVPNRGRDRFTLAHELAHHLLDHGRHLVQESCDDNDFVLRRDSEIHEKEILRMEFQANYFAASLLMPKNHVVEEFHRLIRTLGISNKGFGALYVDHQPCNVRTFDEVTGFFMQRYGVSRAAVKIRLESMDFVQDVRHRSGFRPLQAVLSDPAID